MNKKRQIDGMANVLYHNDRLECEIVDAVEIANALYEAGYRKPKEGKWVFDFSLDGSNFYKCSVCGRQEILLAKENVSEWFPYCHCGAKMTNDPLALKHNEDLIRYNN